MPGWATLAKLDHGPPRGDYFNGYKTQSQHTHRVTSLFITESSTSVHRSDVERPDPVRVRVEYRLQR